MKKNSRMNVRFIIVLIIVVISRQVYGQKKTVDFSSGKLYVTEKASGTKIAQQKIGNWQQMPQPREKDVCIFVDPTHTFQTIEGFGGAITDASAEVFDKLSPANQKKIMAAYYDTAYGIGYSIVRTNMGSCDFSSDSYGYVADNDKSLTTFSIAHDEKHKLPLIKKAQNAIGKNFKLFFSPWSPPAWMKDNNDLLHGGHLQREYYTSWANCFVKFIHAYQNNGVPVWGLTIQNEPMAIQQWESCVFTAEEERDFLKYNLGPTLWKNKMSDKKVIIWDHNRDLLYQYASTILQDKDAAQYVWGTGFHWYETWTGSDPLFDNVKNIHEAFPNTHLVFTEGCKEKFEFDKINDWSLGERYGHQILNDLNNGISAWTDWNILLDEKGGPNHVGNYCFAPVHADLKSDKLYFTNAYWYIGQFSKYIRPGAKRIITSSNRSWLETTAFVNTDGHLAIVVLNRRDEDIDYSLWIGGKAVNAKSAAHSIGTWVL